MLYSVSNAVCSPNLVGHKCHACSVLDASKWSDYKKFVATLQSAAGTTFLEDISIVDDAGSSAIKLAATV